MKLFLLLIGFAGFGFTTYMAINVHDVYKMRYTDISGEYQTVFFSRGCFIGDAYCHQPQKYGNSLFSYYEEIHAIHDKPVAINVQFVH